ncbi:MAG: AsmA family protein, partial [Rhodobacteraceae bacterium]|nr:AsmA family protein [Paracoccaceae bacterium]
APQAFSIERLNVTNATLIYDAEGSDLVRYDQVDLTLDWPERLGPAVIRAALNPAGEVVTLDATIDQFAGFIAGQVQPVKATISAGGASVSVDGRANTGGDVAGNVRMNIPSTDAFMRALALPAPGLPAGLGQKVEAAMDLTLTSDRKLSLRELSADLGGNALRGAADISLNGTPQINAQFDAGALDLTSVTGAGGADTSAASSAGWPKDAIDASGLAAFNGDIALQAASVNLGTFKLGPTRTILRNDKSRMVFELREVQAYDGVVTGEFVVNNRNGLSVGGKINADKIGLQPVLEDAAGIDRLTGAADFNVSFLGVGQSVDAIMRSLGGNGAMSVGQGKILGIDLDQLMRTGDGSGGTTIFNSLTASFTMNSGDLTNEDLLLALRSFEARGAGRVGLGAQDLDYLFTPIALNLNDGNGLAIPIRLKGPWSGPRIIPDLEAALDLNLEKEKEKLKQEAEEKAKAKVAEKLNLTPTEGQSLEDAAKEKLENKVQDELKRGLLKLLD